MVWSGVMVWRLSPDGALAGWIRWCLRTGMQLAVLLLVLALLLWLASPVAAGFAAVAASLAEAVIHVLVAAVCLRLVVWVAIGRWRP